MLVCRRGVHLVLASIMAFTRKQVACAAQRDAERDSRLLQRSRPSGRMARSCIDCVNLALRRKSRHGKLRPGVPGLSLGVFPRGCQTQLDSSLNTAVLDLDRSRWYNCPLLQLRPASQGSSPRVTRENALVDHAQISPVDNLARLCHFSRSSRCFPSAACL